jgi:hypothetical protein
MRRNFDRRFFRRKCDTATTVAAFAGTVRSVTDLEPLTVRLIGVVVETMLPTHVWLWLRSAEQEHVWADRPYGEEGIAS